MKYLITIYAYYGKSDGQEIFEQWVDDNLDHIKDSLKESIAHHDTIYGNIDDFVDSLGTLELFTDNHDDWDSPTGYSVTMETKHQYITELNEQYVKDIERIDKMFEDNN